MYLNQTGRILQSCSLTTNHKKILDEYGYVFFDETTLSEYYQLCEKAKRYVDDPLKYNEKETEGREAQLKIINNK